MSNNTLDMVAARKRLEGLQLGVENAKERLLTQKGRREAALKVLSQASGDSGVENSRKGVEVIGKKLASVEGKLAVTYTKLENDFPFEW